MTPRRLLRPEQARSLGDISSDSIGVIGLDTRKAPPWSTRRRRRESARPWKKHNPTWT
jgi:hypothetical protein